jgi:hypothetical protein
VAVWLCDGRRKAKGVRRGEAMAGLGSSLAGTGLAALILSARLLLMGGGGGSQPRRSFVGADKKAYPRG